MSGRVELFQVHKIVDSKLDSRTQYLLDDVGSDSNALVALNVRVSDIEAWEKYVLKLDSSPVRERTRIKLKEASYLLGVTLPCSEIIRISELACVKSIKGDQRLRLFGSDSSINKK